MEQNLKTVFTILDSVFCIKYVGKNVKELWVSAQTRKKWRLIQFLHLEGVKTFLSHSTLSSKIEIYIVYIFSQQRNIWDEIKMSFKSSKERIGKEEII